VNPQISRAAHEITKPDNSKVISLTGGEWAEGLPGHTVTEVRGYDDPQGRGFVVVERDGGR
jgi:hypothetical protein